MPDALLVDDDAARRAVVEAALEAAGYQVHVFCGGPLRTGVVQPMSHDARSAPAVVPAGGGRTPPTAHALARWSRALVPLTATPEDPRTLQHWARWTGVSPGALRAWCRAVGVSPRRSLVFARLLRAVCLRDNGRYTLENLLNVVDQRTLVGLLRFAGFRNVREFPSTVSDFLQRQTLIRDAAALAEITRALGQCRQAHVPCAYPGKVAV